MAEDQGGEGGLVAQGGEEFGAVAGCVDLCLKDEDLLESLLALDASLFLVPADSAQHDVEHRDGDLHVELVVTALFGGHEGELLLVALEGHGGVDAVVSPEVFVRWKLEGALVLVRLVVGFLGEDRRLGGKAHLELGVEFPPTEDGVMCPVLDGDAEGPGEGEEVVEAVLCELGGGGAFDQALDSCPEGAFGPLVPCAEAVDASEWNHEGVAGAAGESDAGDVARVTFDVDADGLGPLLHHLEDLDGFLRRHVDTGDANGPLGQLEGGVEALVAEAGDVELAVGLQVELAADLGEIVGGDAFETGNPTALEQGAPVELNLRVPVEQVPVATGIKVAMPEQVQRGVAEAKDDGRLEGFEITAQGGDVLLEIVPCEFVEEIVHGPALRQVAHEALVQWDADLAEHAVEHLAADAG